MSENAFTLLPSLIVNSMHLDIIFIWNFKGIALWSSSSHTYVTSFFSSPEALRTAVFPQWSVMIHLGDDLFSSCVLGTLNPSDQNLTALQSWKM